MLLVPPPVATMTSTVPSAPAGAVAEIELSLLTVNCAALAPKSTVVAKVNPVPVIATVLPPVFGPDAGLTPVTGALAGRCR